MAELSKFINRHKVADIRKYDMETIEHALKNGGSLKAVKRNLGIIKNQMYALRDKESNVAANIDKIVKVTGEFYRDLYSCQHSQDDNGRRSSQEELDIPPVSPEEVKKASDAMQRGRSAEGQWADCCGKSGHPLSAMPHDLEHAGILEEH